ncbi:MAG TPA: AAA family ATPase [Candidatus Dormibacteraeota bacterium]|nr:AAA family ATPase [Candidatus Dormibacteraeota bacterium]
MAAEPVSSLYGGECLADLLPGGTAYLVESVTEVKAGQDVGLPVVCADIRGGSEWPSAYNQQLAGLGVVCVPSIGWPNKYGIPKWRAIFHQIAPTAGSVRQLRLPSTDPAAVTDLSSYLEHHSATEFLELVRAEAMPVSLATANSRRQDLSGDLDDLASDRLLTRRLADVEPTRVSWLWRDRVAKGRLSLVIGHPGEGKSWLTMAVAASLTLGVALPGEATARKPIRVLLASAEDDPGDTLRPRFDGLRGDPKLITLIDGVRADHGERGLVIPRDIAVLVAELAAAQLAGNPYGLLILDPLAAYLAGDLDSHRDVSVRAALAPLARLAQTYGVAILAVVHLTKAARDTPMLRTQGSIAFTAAARTVLAVGRNPADPENTPIRHLLMVKSNVGPPAPGLMFTLEGGLFGWLGESPLTGQGLMAPRPEEPDDDSATQILAAQALLRDQLADGPQWSADVDEAAREAGFTLATVRRARQGVAVAEHYSVPGGKRGDGAWHLRLPESPAHTPPNTPPPPPRQRAPGRHATTLVDQGAHSPDEGDQGAHAHEGSKTADLSSELALFTPPTDQGAQRTRVERLDRLDPSEPPTAAPAAWPDGTPYRLPDAPASGGPEALQWLRRP